MKLKKLINSIKRYLKKNNMSYEFQSTQVKKIEEKINLKDQATTDGKNNLPRSESETFSNCENEAIVSSDEIRNEEIGFVFQSFHLLPRSTALENVMLPLKYAGCLENEAIERSKKVLEKVGLQDRVKHSPSELSGGQQQRVAIARALVNKPSILFADEPTGNLDSKTGNEVMNLFKDLNNQGQTIIIITHEDNIASQSNRIITIMDGLIESDTRN